MLPTPEVTVTPVLLQIPDGSGSVSVIVFSAKEQTLSLEPTMAGTTAPTEIDLVAVQLPTVYVTVPVPALNPATTPVVAFTLILPLVVLQVPLG